MGSPGVGHGSRRTGAVLAVVAVVAGTVASAGAARPGEFLTGPRAGRPVDIALEHIRANALALGLTAGDVADLRAEHYASSASGTTHVRFVQRVQGIDVYGGEILVNVAADGSIINLHDGAVPGVAAQAGSPVPALSAADAALAAAEHLSLGSASPGAVEQAPTGADRATVLGPGNLSREPIPVRLVWFPGKGVRLAWDLSIDQLDQRHWWSVRVDAATGELLERDDWVVDEVFPRPRGSAPVSRGGRSERGSNPDSYLVYEWPVESPNHDVQGPTDPPIEGRTVASVPWTSASPFGWHDTDGVAGAEFTDTHGNNVHAYEDTTGTGSGTSPDCGASIDCTTSPNFDLDLSQAPGTYQNASIVNLFYWNNFLHDVWHTYGFDEAAGNFQENDYGNGGAGSDSVNAEGQDGGDTCNARFATPVDGSNPRMQMYLCVGADSDFDNGVISHEYAHGISNRLTGGPANVLCLSNSEQMGEGWSDWVGLMMTLEPGDDGRDPRTVGTYLLGQPSAGPGVRPMPYSTDLAINATTYGDIPTQAIPHGVGFVWATMLWDLTWALIDEHGLNPKIDDVYTAGGNNLAMQLVLDGMKLQPCSPGFVDGRDAILAADLALTGSANHCLIWQAFADRGLGQSADQGSSSSTFDGTEAFDLPLECQQVLKINKTTNLDPAQAGAPLRYKLTVTNNTLGPLTGVTVTDAIPENTTFMPGSSSCGGSVVGGVLTAPIGTLAADASVECTFDVLVDPNFFTLETLADDLEAGDSLWSTSGNGDTWTLQTGTANSPSTAWHGQDIPAVSDQRLTLATSLPLSNSPELRFWHHRDLETAFDGDTAYDGAVLEISTDGGASWSDLGPQMTRGGYDGTISTCCGNPLEGRQAFTGANEGFEETVVDLSSFANESALVRFRLGTDVSIEDVGWYVDDVTIDEGAYLVNTADVTASGTDPDQDVLVTEVRLALPDPIFADGFESGSTSAWSGEVP